MDKRSNGGLKGAIIGDIVGSVYEFNNHRSKEFQLFQPRCFFTDDTVMSCAVAYAVSLAKGWLRNSGANQKLRVPEGENPPLDKALVYTMQEFGRAYPGRGYGGRFAGWITSPDPRPYNSWGNGAPMRCSAAGMAALSAEEAFRLGEDTARVTHDHENALLAAGLTAEIIWRARHGASMEELRALAERSYVIRRCDDYALDNLFSEASHLTMPPALAAFLESTSFEDCIRNAVYVGGDTDTIGAIAGAMAEAYWGVPDEIWYTAESFLDDDLSELVDQFYRFVSRQEI